MRQRGFTLITLVFLLFLAGFFALLAMKTVPTYLDYYAVSKSLQHILAERGAEASDGELRETFAKRLDVNSVYSIKASELDISREHGELTLSVPISSKAPMAFGISVSVDLVATASTPIR